MTDYRKLIVQRRKRAQIKKKAAQRREAERLTRQAAKEFPFKRAYLFGSTVTSRPVSVWSDIDVVVEGLPEERYYAMIGYLLNHTSYGIDLKLLESLDPGFQKEVLRQGLLIYERK